MPLHKGVRPAPTALVVDDSCVEASGSNVTVEMMVSQPPPPAAKPSKPAKVKKAVKKVSGGKKKSKV